MPIRWMWVCRLGVGVLALGLGCQAEEPAVVNKKKDTARSPKVTARDTTPTLPSLTLYELLAQNVTLAAGASQQFFAKTDFTGVGKVNLGFYATPDQDLSSTNYLVWWAIPGAPSYVVVDYLQGKNFAFLNSGGASVLPFGNQLMVEIRNNGTQPVTISQVTAFAVAR
jgi:hypothetical protein